jgi:hypothetical protein
MTSRRRRNKKTQETRGKNTNIFHFPRCSWEKDRAREKERAIRQIKQEKKKKGKKKRQTETDRDRESKRAREQKSKREEREREIQTERNQEEEKTVTHIHTHQISKSCVGRTFYANPICIGVHAPAVSQSRIIRAFELPMIGVWADQHPETMRQTVMKLTFVAISIRVG